MFNFLFFLVFWRGMEFAGFFRSIVGSFPLQFFIHWIICFLPVVLSRFLPSTSDFFFLFIFFGADWMVR